MTRTRKTEAATGPLTPADIRRIRKSLGLNQVQAGELLGGGVRAFQKYESGTVTPSASTMDLLRLLEADPTARGALTGTAAPIQQTGARPFEVTGAHIKALTDRFMVALTRRLLTAEAAEHRLPPDQGHVASNITAADGGEDARIRWSGGPERTSYLPSRDCLFQVKAAAVTPRRAAKEVLTTKGDVEPTIRELLEGGGNYIMLCNHPYTGKAVGEREQAILDSITDKGVNIKASQIAFRDADQIASWVNAHPHVATWVLEQTQPGLANTLRTWTHWAGRHEHEYPFVPDERLADVRAKARVTVDKEREVVRVVGLSGVGKSRLVLEALANEDESPVQSSDIVLYGVETEIGTPAVKGAVQHLADLGRRALIVVDRCAEETHVDLAAMVRRSSSKLSLITIDHEVPPGAPPADTVLVERAADKVVEAVIKVMSPWLPSEDLRRLVSFSNGFPQMAVLAAEVWPSDAPLAVTKEHLVDQVVVGRWPADRQQILRTAKLLSAFGMLGFRDQPADELEAVAPLVDGLNDSQLRIGLMDLIRRRVVQPRGRFATVQPRPIAHNLAERQWQEWTKNQWEDVLTRLPRELRERAAKQLAQLNRTAIAIEVAQHLCRFGGPLESFEAIQDEGNARVIDELAQVDARATGDLLTRALDTISIDELRELKGSARGEIRWAVQRIAFLPQSFELGAHLLLKLALAENEMYANNCTGQFKKLFPAYLADTAADGQARLQLLDELIARDEPELNKLLLGALRAGTEVQHFCRTAGIESHGLRPALQPWRPPHRDAVEYITKCLERLLAFALRDDELGRLAKENLANDLCGLILRGFIDFVEEAVDTITSQQGAYWPTALASLGDIITFDLEGSPPEHEPRIRTLIAKVTPPVSDLANRLKLLVTDMPWDFPCDVKLDFEEREKKQREAIYDVAGEALKAPEALMRSLPDLCAGQQRMADLFGAALAELTGDKLGWLWKIFDSYGSQPTHTWNVDLITSYLAVLAQTKPRLVETFKRRAIRSSKLAWLVPILSFKTDIPASDILLVRDGLRSGVLPVSSLRSWTYGGRLAKREPADIAPLLDQVFSDGDQAHFGCNLLHMYTHGQPERLESFRPQIRLAAETALSSPSNTMNNYHFIELMTWILKHGREDADARAVALSLARQLTERTNTGLTSDEERIRPLLPLLLGEFPEVVWPLIGSAIASDPRRAWRFQHSLGKGFSFGHNSGEAPILELPEDTLLSWCHAHPEVAPAFIAAILPPLSGDRFHPTVQRIIDEFGERKDVQGALDVNMRTFEWSGSMTTYFEMYQQPLSALNAHPKPEVRQWAHRMSLQIEKRIALERNSDEEQDAYYG